MKHSRLFVLSLVSAPLISIGCDVPGGRCVLAAAHGGAYPGTPGDPYLAIFYPRAVSEQGSCADDGSAFAARAHQIYAETFGHFGSEPREVAWTPDEFAYDPDTGAPPDPGLDPIIRGRFTDSVVDASGLCTVEGSSIGQQQLGGVLVSYEFRRVQVVDLASVQGTEILAEVVVTRGDCSRAYDVLGIWPVVPCTTQADCNPLPDPEHGRPNGSDVLPSLPVECNTGPVLGDGQGNGHCFFPDASPAGFPFLAGT